MFMSSAPFIPRRRRGAVMQKRSMPHVTKVLAIASGKGGVGKSTVAATSVGRRLRVGILDLDTFGPSVPTLMGGAILPIINHGLPTMSMGYLLPKSNDNVSRQDVAVVWRGLMVQKAVLQLFEQAGLDVLVIDMPPGTGDVPLTLGQLVLVDGAVIVSTPQDVAWPMFAEESRCSAKFPVPVRSPLSFDGLIKALERLQFFGSPDAFRRIASTLRVDIPGEPPVVKGVSVGSDKGVPYALTSSTEQTETRGAMS
ncbi:P-loop containing nucleoside triphosphate hydrolase protein [Phlebopus sp. FC_14]|nr:P-loop containing nucleoside triphosphate hydrolase protein [Phlebopus sp. FC_14]